ncbi:small heat shock protein IbpA [Agarivorans sp. OAG1]|uniref:16 kDa heat shock protein A n=1 Tax=Agarivorans albus MKT 106 TaxID=1331007 RepID=R9PQX9_AGAAL|nr:MULTISPECIES: Hsp20 family protein [Agarivorans]MPW31131.1 Hsp20 family protein [Agarivorans sp. B2Z047]UQN42901.1 Hsp20 family protein [Agarivorans sp. B2Z047]BEU01205.1 small heat shock protein IbpA [Agarivorans sp. OAG1]GAD00516.1 16 kDa heat shock protein A [Agarivorans albus MKT 106]
MRNQYDFSPLYRTAIGFDRLANFIEAASNQSAQTQNNGYPPYNIEAVDENNYRITLAVAGFAEDELSIVAQENALIVTGTKQKKNSQAKFLHQGIAERGFERKYQIADHVKVKAANLENGLLFIELEREIPEALKPKQIPINGKLNVESLEAKSA